MAENKKSFLLYCDYIELFEELTDAEAGMLIKHILRYVNDKNPEAPNSDIAKMFILIKHQLKRDLKKWDELREKRSEAGKASAEAKRKLKEQDEANSTSVESVEQTPTNSTVNVTVTDNVSVTVKEINNKSRRFTPPNQDDVVLYFTANGYTQQSAIRAFNHYNVADWKDTTGKQVKNWKQKMNTVWFKEENKINENKTKNGHPRAINPTF